MVLCCVVLCLDVNRRGRLPTDESEDVTTSTGTGGSDKDKKQGGVSTWGSLFAGAGQGGRSGGMSPTRSSEVKRAIRAAMAFGLPKGGSGGEGAGAGGESGRSSPTAAKDNEPEMDVDLDGAGKGKGTHVFRILHTVPTRTPACATSVFFFDTMRFACIAVISKPYSKPNPA